MVSVCRERKKDGDVGRSGTPSLSSPDGSRGGQSENGERGYRLCVQNRGNTEEANRMTASLAPGEARPREAGIEPDGVQTGTNFRRPEMPREGGSVARIFPPPAKQRRSSRRNVSERSGQLANHTKLQSPASGLNGYRAKRLGKQIHEEEAKPTERSDQD